MSSRSLNPGTKLPVRFILASLITGFLLFALFTVNLSTPSAATPPETVSASETDILMSGAIFASLDPNDVTLSCSETGVVMESGFNGSYATRISLSTATGQVGLHDLGASASTLELSLLDEAGQAYRTFSATEGSLELTPNGGRFSAVLWDEASEQLFLSTRWHC